MGEGGMKNPKRGEVTPFYVMEALREANRYADKGDDMIHLSLGQPGDTAPLRVRQKASEMMLAPHNYGYTEAMGVWELRQRIARHYKDFYGLDLPPERVVVTVGSSAAVFMTLLSAFEHGDKIAIANPCYPAYPNMMHALGLEPLYMQAGPATNFQPTVAMLEALPQKPDGLVIASPSNPTGTIIDPVEMQNIIAYCDKNKIRLISDEIYHGITYDGRKVQTTAALSDQAVVVNSFSKYFLMPGWRLGWAIMPESLLRSYESLLQNFFLSPPAIPQYAAIEVFDCMDELNAVVKNYAKNRAIMLEALPKMGLDDLATPQGAFYIYANVSKLTNDSMQFCRDIMHHTGVVAVPGHDFDRENGHAFMRFSFAGKEERVREAMERLGNWLQK